MNGYNLSRMWFDFAFENPELIKPTHAALYFFAIEHCNRLGWKSKFGLPSAMAMEAIGVKSYRTYKDTLSDLIDWGFLEMVQKSSNQYSSNIIAIVKNTKANAEANDEADTKALDKALQKHRRKHCRSTGESIVSIDKQINNRTIEPINLKTIKQANENSEEFSECVNEEEPEETEIHPTERVAAFWAENFPTKPTEEEKEKVAPKRKNTQLEILDQCELPFDSDNFMKHWLLFLDYKQKQRKPYTSTVGMQAALRKCSEYPEAIVIQSLLDSMSNNWQGFFPEKTKPHGKQTGNQTGKPSIAEQFQRIRDKINAGNSFRSSG